MSEEAQDGAAPREPGGGAGAAEGPARLDACTNVSHTHIGQMTASCAPAAPRDSAKWLCDVCTYENFPMSRKCTMCRSAKPLLGEDIFRLQDGAAALPDTMPAPPGPQPTHTAHNDDTGAECVSERVRPLRISSPAPTPAPTPVPAPAAPAPPAPAARALHKWSCQTCTYENWPKSLKCAMCGASAGAATATQPHDHTATVTPQQQHNTPEHRHNRTNTGVSESAESDAACGRRKRRQADWVWLQACLGVLEGDTRRVDAYLSAGGDPARALTQHEVLLLNRASAFDSGHTLVHLAIRFQRQDILSTLLSRISGGGPGLKRSPSYIAPDLAAAIRRHIAGCVRHKKGTFPARYINEFSTFTLPPEVEELPAVIQEQLFAELLDRDAQRTLEADPPRINWSREITLTLGSRLYALWNRSAGDCLPDAVCQAAYGVADRSNALRAALADTMHHAQRSLYERWQSWERFQASLLQYAPEEAQLRAEWGRLAAAAARPGTALHQLHVFALSHVMRRPIIVYGVNVVNSFRGEAIGYARFHGVYLPLLWEPSFCCPSPLCLGYTRGHFSALVPVEPDAHRHTYICREPRPEEDDDEADADEGEATYLPLTEPDGKLLPVHFLTVDEMSDSEGVLRRYVRAAVSGGGRLCAVQRAHRTRRPLLQAQMMEEWLNHYRRLAQQTRGPFPPRLQRAPAHYSSDPDTDDE